MVERRLTWLAGIVLIWGAAISYKLISLQIVHHEEYVQKARARQEKVIEIPAARGAILDRTGRPLALSVRTDSVSIDPLKVPDLDVAARILADALHLDRADVRHRIHTAYDNHRGFLWIKREISTAEANELHDLHLDWVQMQSESQRHYPKGTLAAHVLGGVDFAESGNAGIEMALDENLRGEVGEARLLTDVKHRGIDQQLDMQGHAGAQITLTIDERLQYVAEQELAAAVAKHGAYSGSVVVMNPYDGQVLALASFPTYDPNDPPTAATVSARANHATGVPFEPGSVFKVVTLSAALETTKLGPDSQVDCHGGVLTLYGRTIHDSHGGLGMLKMSEVLAHSSNIGAIQIGLQVGRDNMFDYVRRFGFGQKIGLPLGGESKGHVTPLKAWQATSLASVSMGHEVSVTTMQLAQAASVIANGGLRVSPRLVLKEDAANEAVAPPVRVLKPETAITMRQMMEGVVLNGTGKAARIPGYTVGGKTGSATIFDFATKRYTHVYNGTFMGFAPVTNPAVVVVVTLNGTHGEAGFGGEAAAPVFKVVMAEALRILEVPKDLPDAPEPAHTLIAKASTADLSVGDVGINPPNILDDKDDEEPAPQGPQAPAAVKDTAGSTVPNFRGMSLRDVLMTAAAKGLSVQPDGSGVARMQTPPAGATLHQGERIRVQFAR